MWRIGVNMARLKNEQVEVDIVQTSVGYAHKWVSIEFIKGSPDDLEQSLITLADNGSLDMVMARHFGGKVTGSYPKYHVKVYID